MSNAMNVVYVNHIALADAKTCAEGTVAYTVAGKVYVCTNCKWVLIQDSSVSEEIELSYVRCEYCGYKVSASDIKCANCGAPV